MPQVQRRRERNQREQKRSNEISSQIDGLRRVLTDAGVAVKASKSAILVGTAQYIRALQRKHEELEAERRRMLSEMCVLLQQAPRVSDPPPEPEQPPAAPPPPPVPPSPAAVAAAAAAAGGARGRRGAAAGGATAARRGGHEEEPIILARPPRAPDRTALDRRDDLDQIYELVFADSAVPMAVVTLDGKFLRTNVRFEAASGYGRTELERITVFNLTAPAHLHVTFSFMSLVLRGLDPASHLFVCAVTRESRPAPFALAMSLVTRDGRAQKLLREPRAAVERAAAASRTTPSASARCVGGSSSPASRGATRPRTTARQVDRGTPAPHRFPPRLRVTVPCHDGRRYQRLRPQTQAQASYVAGPGTPPASPDVTRPAGLGRNLGG